MPANAKAADVLGTLGAVCWSIQLLPQIWINARRKNTTGLQPTMMMLWAVAGVPLGVYNIVEKFNIALRVQPQILTFLSLVTWGQCMYYSKKRSVLSCVVITSAIGALLGGIETAGIFALEIPKRKNLEWPLILMAFLSAAFLGAGVLRHYWDIYRHRSVRGISFIFVAIDAGGDLFSMVSLVFEPTLNFYAMIIYGFELVLWIGIMLCGLYYNLRPWLRRKFKQREEAPEHELANFPPSSSSTSVFRTTSLT